MLAKFLPFEVDAPMGPAQGTLVCIPGLNSGAYMFTGAKAVLPNWQIVRFATPGVPGVPLPMPFSAKSYAASVAAHLQTLPTLPQPVVVLGHSLGGYAAQELARLCGEKISKVILVSTSRGQPDTARDLANMESAMGQNFWAYMKALAADPATGLAPLFGKNFPLHHPAIYQQFLQQREASLPEKTASLAQLTAGGMFSSVRWVHKLTLPTLVVHGTADILVSHASGHALAAALPNARLLGLHGVGHFPMLEHANFWRHVADFCQGATLGDKVQPASGWRAWLRDLWSTAG